MAGPIVRLLSQLQGILGISQGGTGGSTTAAARENLGLKIGTDVQAFSPTLAGLAAATWPANTLIGGDGDGVPSSLALGAGFSIDTGTLNFSGGGGGGWTTDGTTASTSQLVRIGVSASPAPWSSYSMILGANGSATQAIASYSDSSFGSLVIGRSRGSSSAMTPVQNGDVVGRVNFQALNNAGTPGWTLVGSIVCTVSGTFTTTPGTQFDFSVRAPDGSSFIYMTAAWNLVTITRRTRIDCLYGATNVATDASTVTFDCSVASVHRVTLGGNRTLALSNDLDDQRITLILKQDGTGGRTVTWFSGITWMTDGGAAPTLAAGANKRTIVLVLRESSDVYLGWNLGTES